MSRVRFKGKRKSAIGKGKDQNIIPKKSAGNATGLAAMSIQLKKLVEKNKEVHVGGGGWGAGAEVTP